MIVCNIQLQNKKDSFIKKSYSIPVGIFPGNKATIDDKGNIYVATGMLGVVQKFNKNGDFIKSILIKDDIDMIKNERDGIHVYAGKFDYTDYHITEKKIIEKEISETDLDHIKSGPNELVIGNFWIFKGKITILKSSLFPIDVEIVLSYNDEETDWKVKKNISKFIYRLKKYRTGNRFSGEYTYKINQDSELYKQIIEFYKSNRKDVEFICLDYDVKVSDEEFEKVKAFVLCFPEYYCEEYEDIENEYSECESCHSKEKTNSLFYAQPKGYIKKHENDYGFAGLDGTGELLLLPKLVEKLKKSGVDKKYFQPIISKSKKILGYTFITDNILPQKSYIDENYKFENQCEKCERINMTENENIFYFIPKRITEEGIKNLKDVNKTYEFYDEYREIIISKKVAQIIKENVPYAKFYPVILDNRN